MAPGKPVTLTEVNGTPIFGMPGPSIASLTVFREFVTPLLKQWGVPIPPDTCVKGILTREEPAYPPFDMFLMMNVNQDNGKILISPVERKFGQMMGVRADAVLHVSSENLAAGQEVEVRLLRWGYGA